MKEQSTYLNSSSFYTGTMIARKHKITITPELIYLVEALKVEGYWSLKRYSLTIQNKNLPFLRHIESIVNKLGVNIHKRILIKIKPTDQNFVKEDASLICDSKLLNFYLEKSPFDGSKKIVTSLPYKTQYTINLNLKGVRSPIKIEESTEEILVRSQLKSWAYADIRFPQIDLLRFFSEFLGEKKNLKVEQFLFEASKEYVASAFSALIDAEGSLDLYGFYRKLRIRMRSKNYLQDWQKLLNLYEIAARFQKNNEKEYELAIEGWEDFNKLNELGLRLYHSGKFREWSNILGSYKRNQVSRNTALQFYTKKLQEIAKPITARELALILHKDKRTVNHYLTILMKKDRVVVNKSNVAYLYSSK